MNNTDIFDNECVAVRVAYRIVKHSERPLAYGIDWLFQRVGG